MNNPPAFQVTYGCGEFYGVDENVRNRLIGLLCASRLMLERVMEMPRLVSIVETVESLDGYGLAQDLRTETQELIS